MKTLESFGPELMAALIAGSRKEVRIKMEVVGGWRKAWHLRQRLNSLRVVMRKGSHPQYRLVSKAKIKIIFGEEAGYPKVDVIKKSTVYYPKDRNVFAQLIISPHDEEYGGFLRQAGITTEDIAHAGSLLGNDVEEPADEEAAQAEAAVEAVEGSEEEREDMLNEILGGKK